MTERPAIETREPDVAASAGLTFEIRTAVPAQADALRRLHRRSSSIWAEDRAALDAHPEVFGVDPLALAGGRTRVAVGADGAIVGFATVTERGELDDLFVEPDRMRGGIGTALVADAVDRAATAGHRCLTVVAAPRTLAFYERAGFTVVAEATTRFGPALSLSRPLQKAHEPSRARRRRRGSAGARRAP